MSENRGKIKKTMTKDEALRFHKTWSIAFVLGGVLMIFIGTEGAIALYNDINEGFVWWMIGLLFIGAGIGELRSYRKMKKSGDIPPVQEKIGDRGEKI
jgi:hypothetical protein